jgi:hypothetical protein
MAAEINQINNQKRDDHSRKAESEHIADMIAGDASARPYRRNRRLPCSPLVGFLIVRRTAISLTLVHVSIASRTLLTKDKATHRRQYRQTARVGPETANTGSNCVRCH